MIDKETFNKYFTPEKVSLPKKQSELIAINPEYIEDNIIKKLTDEYNRIYYEALEKLLKLVNIEYKNNDRPRNVYELINEIKSRGYNLIFSSNRISLFSQGIPHTSVVLEIEYTKTDDGIKAELIYKFE